MSEEKKTTEDLANDLWGDDTTKPESSWFSFEKVGDTIAGELVESYKNEGKFGMQQLYVIKTPEGDEVIVPLKHTTHKIAVQQLKSAEVGDVIAFRYSKDIPTDYGNPAKAVEVRIRRVKKS
jgi:hypothetical protein